MSTGDVESQVTHPNQQANTPNHVMSTEATQSRPGAPQSSELSRFRRQMKDHTAKSRAKLKAFLQKVYGVHRTKIEPTDGYTTHSFNNLTKPLPVKDFFFSARTMIIARLAIRGLIFVTAGFYWTTCVLYVYLWILTLVALAFQMAGIHGIGRLGIPTVKQLWSFHRYPQRFWEIVGSRFFLYPPTAAFWWYGYLLFADISDFEHNFVNAWGRRPTGSIMATNSAIIAGLAAAADLAASVVGYLLEPRRLVVMIVENEHLNIPILSDNLNDSALLEQLRMFYRYLKVKQGLVELLIPRLLIQIDCVEVSESGKMAGEITGTLDCGRGLQHFHYPNTANKTYELTRTVQKLYCMPVAAEPIAAQAVPAERPEGPAGAGAGAIVAIGTTAAAGTIVPPDPATGGLEFVRALDRSAIGGVIIAPSVASLVFIAVWLSIYLRKTEDNSGKVDQQAVVATAFTVASYLVTAGALITGLVAYLDNSQRDTNPSSKEE